MRAKYGHQYVCSTVVVFCFDHVPHIIDSSFTNIYTQIHHDTYYNGVCDKVNLYSFQVSLLLFDEIVILKEMQKVGHPLQSIYIPNVNTLLQAQQAIEALHRAFVEQSLDDMALSGDACLKWLKHHFPAHFHVMAGNLQQHRETLASKVTPVCFSSVKISVIRFLNPLRSSTAYKRHCKRSFFFFEQRPLIPPD